MAAEEISQPGALVEDILRVTRLYAGTNDPGLQDSYHKAAEADREELLDLGYKGLSLGLGEERTLGEKESFVAGWLRYVGAKTPSYGAFPGGYGAPDVADIVSAAVPGAGGGEFLGTLGQAAGGVVGATGQIAGAVAAAAPTILRWLPWILGGLYLSRAVRIKANLGRK